MKQYIQKFVGAGATLMGTLMASPVFAQDYLDQVTNATPNLPKGDFTAVLGSLINTALSVLGVVLLLIVLWAGILWMTAGGDDGKIKTAKALITNAVIGLVLILSALAISTFVFDTLKSAVETTG